MTKPNDPINFTGTTKGLTKREIFAAMTMQAILSKPVVDSIKQAAKESVIAADALIKALNETEIECNTNYSTRQQVKNTDAIR